MNTRTMATIFVMGATALVPGVASGQCEPVETARVAIGGELGDLASIDSFRFAAWGSEGLVVLEAIGPDELVRAGSLDLGIEVEHIEAGDDLVFVGGETSVVAVDVSSPRYPRLLDAFEVGGVVNDLTLRGSLLYVAAGDAGLQVLDASTPSAMTLRSTVATAGAARDIAVAGTKAYVTADEGGLLLDFSNPTSPVVLSDQAPGTRRVKMTQTRAYVSDDQGLLIVDITIPTDPVMLASFHHEDGPWWSRKGIDGIRAVNGMLFVLLSTREYEDSCGTDVYSTRVAVFDVTGDTFALIAESAAMIGYHCSSVSLVDSRVLVTQHEPWDGVRNFQIAGSDVLERGRFIGVQQVAQANHTPFAAVNGAVVGAWRANFDSLGIQMYVQSVSFTGHADVQPDQVLLPTLEFPGAVYSFATAGGVLCAAVSEVDGQSGADCSPEFVATSIHAVDLSNPSEPVVLGQAVFEDPDSIHIAAESDTRLYAWSSQSHRPVRIYIVSSPEGLIEAGSFVPTTPDDNIIESLAAHQGYVYLRMSAGLGYPNGLLQVYDAADPEHVQLLSTLAVDWGAVQIVGPYLVARTDTGFALYDLSNPAAPLELSIVQYAHDLSRTSASGGFLAYGDENNISVLDLSDPSDPRTVATLAGAEAFALGDGGRTLFVLREGEIVKIDVTPSGRMEVVATVPTADTAFDVALAPNMPLAYVSDYAGGVRVFDVADPEDPIEVDAFTGLDRAYQAVVLGEPGAELGYIAGGASGLVVMSAEIPTAHGLVGSLATSDLAMALAVRDGYAYVATRFDGLQIIDVGVPGEPVLVGSVDTPGSAQGVTLDGSLVYIADGSGGVQIVDVSNRSLPTIVGSYDTPLSARQVAMYGSVALVPDRATGLIALDVSDPTNPRPISTLGGLGDTRSVAVSGHTAFVTDFGGMVHKVDISDPRGMVLVQSLATLSTPRGLAYDDAGMLYVANGDAGLTAVESRSCWDRSCPADVKRTRLWMGSPTGTTTGPSASSTCWRI